MTQNILAGTFLFVVFISHAYAIDSSFINSENLTIVGQTKKIHGNPGLLIYEDDEGTRWVLRDNKAESSKFLITNAFSHLKADAATYITSKILNLLLSDSTVPVVAEARLLSDSFGTASKWLTGFASLSDYGIEEDWLSVAHPKELNGNLILDREKILLATELTGTTDRNYGNIGIVNANNQYFAAQVDYNESFNFYGCKDLVRETLNGNLDVDSVLIEVDRVIDIPNSSIESLIDGIKEEFISLIQTSSTEKLDFSKYNTLRKLGRDPYDYEKMKYGDFNTEEEFRFVLVGYISKYIDDVKVRLIRNKNTLSDVKKVLQCYKLITDSRVEAFEAFVKNEYDGIVPRELKIMIIGTRIDPLSDNYALQEYESVTTFANVLDLVVKSGNYDMLHFLLADAVRIGDSARAEEIESSFARIVNKVDL